MSDSGGGRIEEPEASLTGYDPDRVRLMDEILAAYPANGNAMEARRALASVNASTPELRIILAKVRALAARWHALPPEDRRYCPGKHTFFGERRWTDDPEAKPWTLPPQTRGSRSRPEDAVSTTARVPGYEF